MHICKYFLCLVIGNFLATSCRLVLSQEENVPSDQSDQQQTTESSDNELDELNANTVNQESTGQNVEVDVETVVETLRMAESLLLENARQVNVDASIAKVWPLVDESQRLKALHSQVLAKRQAVDELIRVANARQLEHLLAGLNMTLERELILRNSQAGDGDAAEELEEEVETVSIDLLKKSFETKSIMKESEQDLKQWVIGIIQEELGEFENSRSSLGRATECASRLDVVHDVQAALTKHWQDGIGMADHAQGASIVHEMTSESYIPPPSEEDMLANVWWSKFIPEDWENLLPKGWEEWNVGVPSFVYHALGIRGAKTAPPTVILHGNTLPGSCWPMDGSSGKVTLRLAYPIDLEAVSVEHVSSLLVAADARKSAPKRIRVIGYPPCDDDKDELCAHVGFDASDSIDIVEVEYNIDGPTIQTFDVLVDRSPSMAETDDEIGDGDEDATAEEEEDSGLCSQSSCSAPQVHTVAGIAFEVLENWGNPDFTCLYRLRVHGDVADS